MVVLIFVFIMFRMIFSIICVKFTNIQLLGNEKKNGLTIYSGLCEFLLIAIDFIWKVLLFGRNFATLPDPPP